MHATSMHACLPSCTLISETVCAYESARVHVWLTLHVLLPVQKSLAADTAFMQRLSKPPPACTFVCTYARAHTHTHIHTYTHTHTHMHNHIHTCTIIYTHAHTYPHTHAYTHLHIPANTYTNLPSPIHAHTHTRKHACPHSTRIRIGVHTTALLHVSPLPLLGSKPLVVFLLSPLQSQIAGACPPRNEFI